MIWFPERIKFETVEEGERHLRIAQAAHERLNSPRLKEQVAQDIEEIQLRIGFIAGPEYPHQKMMDSILDGTPGRFIRVIDNRGIERIQFRPEKEKTI